MFCVEIEVDESWITPVYDHVHHGRMLSMFEQARAALVSEIGFPNEELLREGKVLVVTSANVSYKREVRSGVVRVTCDSVMIRDRTITISQNVLNERGKVAVEAEISLMFMNGATRRGMPVPPEFQLALQQRLRETVSPER